MFKKIGAEKILVYLIKVGLYLSLALPFFVDNSTLFPYVFGRAWAFQILIEVLLIFWLALLWFYPRYRPALAWRGRNIFKEPAVLLNWSLILFFVALILATIFGADPVRSFWGNEERMTGTFTLLHFGLYYFMLISVLPARSAWLWFLRALILVGAVVGVQICYAGFIKAAYRPWAWFGMPGIAGSFLLFFVFLVPLWWNWERRSRPEAGKVFKSVAGGVAILLEFIFLGAVVVNTTRAVWAGLLVTAVLCLLIAPRWLNKGDQQKRRLTRLYQALSISLAAVILTIGFLTISNQLPEVFYRQLPWLGRVRNFPATLKNETRIMSWRQGLAAWTERPLLGYGPENYYIAHNKNFNLTLAQLREYGKILDFDKAHNQFVENWVDLGVIGFLAYFLLLLAGFWSLVKSRGRWLLLLLIAYFTHLLFWFDTTVSYWLFFISLGLVYYQIRGESRVKLAEDKALLGLSQGVYRLNSYWEVKGAILITALVIIIPLLIYLVNIRAYQASRGVAIAKAVGAAGQPVEVVFSFYYQALQENSVFAFEIRKMLGMDVYDLISGFDPKYQDMFLYIAEELAKNSKDDYHSQLMLGLYYNLLGHIDQNNYKKALEFLLSAKQLAPSRYEIYSGLAAVYLSLGNFTESYGAVDKALELGYKPETLEQYWLVARVSGQVGQLARSLEYYQKALVIAPENVQVLGAVAALYKEMGENEKAREMAERILELEPAAQAETEQFLKGL